MGDLRKQWTKAKDLAKFSFQQQPVERSVAENAHVAGLPPYPLKFDKDLGPTLDSLEKAQASKKPADIKKFSDKAKETVSEYNKRISAAKGLSKDTRAILERALTDLSKKL